MTLGNEDERWRPWLAAVRRLHADEGSSTDASMVAELATALLDLAERMASWRGSAVWSLCQRPGGRAQWESACLDKVFGRDTGDDGRRSVRSLMVAMAEQDAAGGLAKPTSFATTAFHRLALTGLRDLWLVEADAASSTDDGPATAPWDAGSAPHHGRSDLGPAVSATALPQAVASTLRHCVRLADVYVLVSERGRDFKPDVWRDLAGYIERDVALGVGRERWLPGADATDNSGRAWQARYHLAEQHEDHTDADEIPPAKDRRRAAFDQHARRFRTTWAAADRCASRAVEARGGATLGDHGRVPLVWDTPRHPTLG